MLRKLAAAVLVASLIAGPALAQGTTQTTPNAPAGTGQPAVKADATKVTHKAKLGLRHVGKRHVAKHHVYKTKVHTAHAVKHIKHVKHARRVTKSHKAG
jgi:hypothetical protein